MDNTSFIQCRVIPRLFSMADRLFPEMEFKQYRGGWRSSHKLDGTLSSRPDKCVITAKVPSRILEQGGDSLSLIDFYISKRNLTGTFYSKFCTLCAELNITPPTDRNYDQWQCLQRKQETIERAVALSKSELYGENGKQILGVLHGKDYEAGERGLDDDFIKWAELGFCSSKVLDILLPEFGDDFGIRNYAKAKNPYFSIPFRSGGGVIGFTFRSIYSHEYCVKNNIPKVINAFFSRKATKRDNLFGLRRHTSGGDYKVLVVEGEMDAMRAEYAGLGDVVATTSGYLSIESLLKLKKAGKKAVVLLFDTEATEESQENTDKKKEKAIQNILAVEMEAYVSCLKTDGGEKTKIDVDSFLRTFDSERLKQCVFENTMRASEWLFERIMKPFGHLSVSSPEFGECRRQIIRLCCMFKTSVVDKEMIYRLFSEETNGYLSDAVLAEETEKTIQKQWQAMQAEKAMELSNSIVKTVAEGNVGEAIKLGKDLAALSDMDNDLRYQKLLSPYSFSDIKEKIKEKPKDIHTGYFLEKEQFDNNGDIKFIKAPDTEIVLPSSALTIIGAPTSHGKTTFLQNLALSLAKSDEDGEVLFVTYEESIDDVATELFVLDMGECLSNNPVRTIRDFYATGDISVFCGSQQEKENTAKRIKEKEADFSNIFENGRLCICQQNPEIEELGDCIRYMNRKVHIKAVFVDYIQCMRKRIYRGDRKGELHEICENLRELSLQTKLPIILGAQLNRQALSPLEMTNQNIADASDIEHSANTILLLWNSSYLPLTGTVSYTLDGDPRTKQAKKLSERGFVLGKEGKMYVVATKSRSGQRGVSGIFCFDGRIRKITSEKNEKINEFVENNGKNRIINLFEN